MVRSLVGHGFGPLDRFGTAIIKAFYALLPCQQMQLVQVALVHVGRQKQVKRLRLADMWRPVGRMFDQPALVDLEGRAEGRFFGFVQVIKMLDRAFVGRDRRPGLVIVLAFFLQQALQMFVAHGEGAAQRLVSETVGRDRFDPRRGATADDGNRRRRRDRHLVRETLHDPVFAGIGAGASFLGQLLARRVGLCADMFEHAVVPDLGHDALDRDQAGLQEGMETHHAQANRALAHCRIGRAGHAFRRGGDEVGQYVVEEAHHVLDEGRVPFPFHIFFEVQ